MRVLGLRVDASLGASLSSIEGNPKWGSYAGLTLEVAERLNVTVAWHVLRVKQPNDGYDEGALLPDDFAGDVPTSDHSRGGYLLALTLPVEL